MDLGLNQKQAAGLIQVSVDTLRNWERQRRQPALPCIPLVVRFLGYDPFPEAEKTEEKLVRCRKTVGMSQRELAATLGVDPSTLARWERGERNPSDANRESVYEFLKMGKLSD